MHRFVCLKCWTYRKWGFSTQRLGVGQKIKSISVQLLELEGEMFLSCSWDIKLWGTTQKQAAKIAAACFHHLVSIIMKFFLCFAVSINSDLQEQNIKRNRWYKSMLYIFLSLYMLGWIDEAMLESFSHPLLHPHLFFSSDHEVLLLQQTITQSSD